MWTRISGVVLVAVWMGCVLAGCSDTTSAGPEFGVPSLVSGTTTPGSIALQNLDAQVSGAFTLWERNPEWVEAAEQVVGLLGSRTQFVGSYADFRQMVEIADGVAEAHPDNPRAHRLAARVASATHRFDEAMAALDAAEALGAEVQVARDGILLARGADLVGVLARAEARVAKAPTFESLVHLGGSLSALGRYDEADAAYLAAAAGYRDVSPLPLAWVSFQRGVMWSESALRPEWGEILYRDALRRLPGFIVANTHLAEIESETSVEVALARLKPLASLTDDPEPSGLVGELLAPSDAPASSDWVSQAASMYEELLAEFPLAFSDHGAEFFMGPGEDSDRALSLALLNYDNRRSEGSLELALHAAVAADRPDVVCELLDTAPEAANTFSLAATLSSVREAFPCP